MKFRIHAQNLPLLTTAGVFVLLFAICSVSFDHFFSGRVAVNLLTNHAHVGIVAIGMTFVILSGGIDLSVGSVLGFTTIFVAALVSQNSMHPAWAMVLGLGIGASFGASMGALIHFYQLPPFLVTLAGMFLMRGLSFVVHTQSIEIRHAFSRAIGALGLPLATGVTLRMGALVFLLVFIVGLFVSRWTRFGRNVYAVGGSEQSSVLMGLPVAPTRIAIYAISGLSAALAGVVLAIDKQSGDPTNGLGLELDAIAAVVIGGTLLSGGVGHLFGTFLGVLIYGTILTALAFYGKLDSSWQRIAIGGLLMIFIGLQRLFTRFAARPNRFGEQS